MPCEHIHKEKEYGITWRTAFKAELIAFADKTHRRLIESDSGFPENEDPFQFLHKIIKKDVLDAATFDAQSQADFLCMMIDNLEHLEQCIFQIKALLKEPDHLIFSDVKTAALERVRAEQFRISPNRPQTVDANQADASAAANMWMIIFTFRIELPLTK